MPNPTRCDFCDVTEHVQAVPTTDGKGVVNLCRHHYTEMCNLAAKYREGEAI